MSNRVEQNHGSPQILIVDDTPANLRLLTDILKKSGYRVRPASSGSLALRSVAVDAPDLILLDVKMPDMDGYEVCRHLKADEHSRRIPVIFVSALDELIDRVKGFDAGALTSSRSRFTPPRYWPESKRTWLWTLCKNNWKSRTRGWKCYWPPRQQVSLPSPRTAQSAP